MTICHLLILFLLSVDWLEDPYQGQWAYSCPMASTPCNAHQDLEPIECTLVEHFTLPNPFGLRASMLPLPLEDFAPELLLRPPCIPTLHILMSLQQ
jgi:hypothetical protein